MSELAVDAGQYLEATLPNEQGAAALMSTEVNVQKGSEQRYSEQGTSTDNQPSSQEEQNIVILEGQFAPVPPDSDQDMGYSSHSTCSSCQMMDQGSQFDYHSLEQNPVIDWSDIECEEGCLYGDDEIEDLIYHFDRYFRGRIDSDLKQVQNMMHCMLTEQQIHVRQIVNKAIKYNVCEQTTELCSKEISSPPDKKTKLLRDFCTTKCSPEVRSWLQSNSTATSTSDIGTKMSATLLQSPNLKTQHGRGIHSPQADYLMRLSDESSKHFSKEKLLLYLMSLNCQVSNMLQKQEYKI